MTGSSTSHDSLFTRMRSWLIFFAVTLVLLSLATAAIYLVLDRPRPGIDDAYIYLVYAENILDAEGIVYNTGGERVEGFTSPLWLVLVTITTALCDRPETCLLAASLLLTAAALASLWYYISGGHLLHGRSLLFLVWVFASPAFIFWMTLPLMDVSLWSALLVLTSVAVLKGSSSRVAAIMIALLILARPEGMLWGFFFVVLFALRNTGRNGIATLWPKVRTPLALYVGTVSILVSLRLAYFGYPLPNTYYAKVSPDVSYNLLQGAKYLAGFIANYPLDMALIVGATFAGLLFKLPKIVAWISGRSARIDPQRELNYSLMALVVMLGLLTPILSGGDHFKLFRFYQPIWPLMILPVLFMVDDLQRTAKGSRRYLALSVFILLIGLTPTRSWGRLSESLIAREFRLVESGRVLAESLNRLFEQEAPTVAYAAVGALAYHYDGDVYDIYGLNNVAMAHSEGKRYGLKNHSAFNVDVFMDQQPALFGPLLGQPESLRAAAQLVEVDQYGPLKGIYADRRFQKQYARVLISSNDTGHHVLAWVNRSFLPKLSETELQAAEIDYRLVSE
ncbi:MAG: hypothetical protein R3300_05565 [Candidatus Promineifilaceae bacterium]|nr:hypothetical protein [Candidatus Promineifilaceae bacterium]